MKRASFYYPGLISLALLPLFCAGYFVVNWKTPRRGIDARYVYIRGVEERSPFNIDTAELRKYRKYEDISTADNIAGSSNALYLKIEKSLKHLIASKDTVHGIRMKFGPKTSYANYVTVVDISSHFNNDNIRAALFDDECVMFYTHPQSNTNSAETELKPLLCGTGRRYTEDQNKAEFIELLNKPWTVLKDNLRYMGVDIAWVYIAGTIYLLMVVLAVYIGLFKKQLA